MKASADWHPAARIFFRFGFVYLLLFILPFPLGTIPYTEALAAPYTKLWDAVVPWVGRHVLGLSYEIGTVFNGSGDRTYDYVQSLCLLMLAAAAALVWSLLDRKRTAYTRLYQWLRVYVRLCLGTVMIFYGAFKVINSQFPAPGLDRYLQPFGDASPMGLLWTFMGSSEPYTIFTGAAEMLGGILLFARRTTTLGALVCAGVLTNVVMLNFSYDVPVKLYSLHLLALALFLAAPEFRRLVNLFLLNRTAEPAVIRPLFERAGLNRAALVLRTLFLAAVVGLSLYQSYQVRRAASERSPLYGVWEVEEFTTDGQLRPPLVTDQERWRRVTFDRPGAMAVQTMSDPRQRYRMELDAEQKRLSLTKVFDPSWKAAFTYEQPEPGLLTLAGDVEGRPVQAKLRLVGQPQFLLMTRGFHWINESPFNR
ncbi:MAG TPA: hypothetical protein VJT74_06065 [Pyrinomonadaceae bacterium]|nr:hypothetical protein [Pyrinomonadaceae bacterium]